MVDVGGKGFLKYSGEFDDELPEGIDNPVQLNTVVNETGEIGSIVIPEVTAYKIDLYAAFHWPWKDRTTAGGPIREFVIGVDGFTQRGEDGNLPGVEYI